MRGTIELSLDHVYGNKVHRAYRDDQLIEERRELLQAWQDYCDCSSADVVRLPMRESTVNNIRGLGSNSPGEMASPSN